jgi:hypothetical protein
MQEKQGSLRSNTGWQLISEKVSHEYKHTHIYTYTHTHTEKIRKRLKMIWEAKIDHRHSVTDLFTTETYGTPVETKSDITDTIKNAWM